MRKELRVTLKLTVGFIIILTFLLFFHIILGPIGKSPIIPKAYPTFRLTFVDIDEFCKELRENNYWGTANLDRLERHLVSELDKRDLITW